MKVALGVDVPVFLAGVCFVWQLFVSRIACTLKAFI